MAAASEKSSLIVLTRIALIGNISDVYIARFRRRGVELLTKLMYHVQVCALFELYGYLLTYS